MESKHGETSVTLGISIPIDSSRNREVSRENASNQQPDVLSEQFGFSNLINSLDPNLGIMGQLPSADIDHEKGTFNPWNIEPSYLNILPQYASNSNENSILIVGGLNPSSILEKIPPDIDMDDLVLGSTIFQYVLDSGIWKYYGTMIEPRCYHACALDGQYLYITGGYSLLKRKHGEMIAISSTDRLNLIDRKWKSCANMVLSRASHALVAHREKLYAFGGRNSQGSILASVEMYDPHQDFWFEITSLPQPTMGLSATCIKDSVWLIGGITNDRSENLAECLSSNVFSFVTSLKKWYEEAPLPYACAFSSCISNDYALWLIGGCTVSKNLKEKNMISCSSVLKLSLLKKSKWKPVASLLHPRHALAAVLYGDNIYVFGGVESSNKCASGKVEVINIIGNIISTMCTRMPVPIAGCASILIVPEKDDYTYTEDASDTLSTFSERINYNTGVEDYYSSESSKTSSTLDDVYDVNRDTYLPAMSNVNKETFPKKNENIETPVTQESSTFSERKQFKTGVDGYYSGESSKTSSKLEDVYDMNRNKHLTPMSPINKERSSKENEKIEIPVTQESSTVSEREKLKTGVEDCYTGESPKTSSTSEDGYDVNKDKYLSHMSPVNKETFPKENEKIEIPVAQESSTVSEKKKLKTGVDDYYSGESPKTSSSSEDACDVNKNKYLPCMSPENKDTFPEENEKIEIPITEKSSSVSEKNMIKTGVENYYSSESSKTSSTLDDVYDVNRDKYLPPMSPINKETFPKKNEKFEVPVTEESSAFEKDKISVNDYYSGGSSKTSSTLEDIYNVNKNIHLSTISAANQLHSGSFKETFSKKMKNIETPVILESFKKKGLFTSKINEFETNRNKEIRYRTSMEIFLDSGEFGLYASKRESSQALKWLNYYKKFSLSDEKLHKEVFQSKAPELHVKTEVVDTEINLKSPEIKKHFTNNEKLDYSSTMCVQSSLSSQHKSFMYTKSNIKEKLPGVNVHQDNEKRRKATSQDTVISEIIDLKLDILHKDAPDEIKILINEDNFPIILLIGGEYSKKPIESRYILTYYCKKDVWYYAGELPEYRIFHSAVLVNNKIYIIGGFRSENSKFSENITNKTMYFDICDKLWYNTASINHPRAHHSAVVLKDKIYILGGRDQSGQILSSVEVYDESNNIWKESKSLPYPVLGTAAFSLDDSIHIFGGITYEEDDEIISVNTAIFDTKKNSWIVDFKMPIPLAFCGIANDLNSVWLLGGLTIEENSLISSKDIYKSDIFTKMWTKILELSTPRLAPVTVLIEKKVYVIGGHSTQEKKEVLTCELIDLVKNEIFLLKNSPIGISGRAGVVVTEQCKTERK